MLRLGMAVLVIGVALSVPAPAWAQQGALPQGCNPTQEVYGGGDLCPIVDPKDPPERGSLPFTGLEVGLLALGGLALLGTGFALRRAATLPRRR